LVKLARSLNLNKTERKKLKGLLGYLDKKGLLKLKGDKVQAIPRNKISRGIISLNRRGFAFVTPETAEGGSADIFIPPGQTAGALTGDLVEVMVREEGPKGKTEGRVTRILRRGRTAIFGLYLEINYQPFALPLDTVHEEPFLVKLRSRQRPKPGQIIEIDRLSLEVKKIIGYQDEPGVDVKVVIDQYNLRDKFGQEALAEAAALPVAPRPEDFSGRIDYRDWTTITIDGEKAQDFDDALSIKKLATGHYLLGVHIADVSHYVKPGSPLDQEAYLRERNRRDRAFPGRVRHARRRIRDDHPDADGKIPPATDSAYGA